MTEEEVLGKELIRMIRELRTAAGDNPGYLRKRMSFTGSPSFPGGAVHLFVVNDAALADLFEQTAVRRGRSSGIGVTLISQRGGPEQ